MYFHKKDNRVTYSVNNRSGIIGKYTVFNELPEYTYQSVSNIVEEVIPGQCYIGKGGLKLIAIKCIDNDRVIVKLREGSSTSFPLIYLNKDDIDDIDFQDNLFIFPKKLIQGKERESRVFNSVLITISGFTIHDDYSIIEVNGSLVDLELFLISLSVCVKETIEPIGSYGLIESGTPLKYRIITTGNRSENHIVSEDGTIRLEVLFPREVYLVKGVQYFSITFDDSFSVDSKTGQALHDPIKIRNKQWINIKPYFEKEGRWRNIIY